MLTVDIFGPEAAIFGFDEKNIIYNYNTEDGVPRATIVIKGNRYAFSVIIVQHQNSPYGIKIHSALISKDSSRQIRERFWIYISTRRRS